MSAVCQENSTNKTRVLLFLLIVAVICFIAVNYATEENFNFINYNSHAVDKHGTEALSVRNCLNDYGGIHKFFNPNTNRYAEICFLEIGKFGIQITEEENEITSFIKNKFRTLKQVIRYIENSGYTNQIY